MLELPHHMQHQVFSEILDIDVRKGKKSYSNNSMLDNLIIDTESDSTYRMFQVCDQMFGKIVSKKNTLRKFVLSKNILIEYIYIYIHCGLFSAHL